MKRYILIFLLLVSACTQNIQPTPTHELPTASATATISVTATLAASLAPAPYEQYTIEHLRQRTYGGGKMDVLKVLADNDTFTRYLIRYPSDGLKIYGFINIPKTGGVHPVIIAVHGAGSFDTYASQKYETDLFDLFTQQDYIVIFPNLRKYLPSDDGDNLFRVGMTVDVLNLIALVKAAAGPPGLFDNASHKQIGLFGYSMGGDIVLRALTVSSEIKAAVLYSSLSGDEAKNSQLLWQLSGDLEFKNETVTPPEVLKQISPNNYYQYINAPVQLFHGTADPTVPVAFAQDTCSALTNAGVNVNCMYFTGEGHSFRSRVSEQFNNALLAFYKKYLTP